MEAISPFMLTIGYASSLLFLENEASVCWAKQQIRAVWGYGHIDLNVYVESALGDSQDPPTMLTTFA